MTQFWDSREYWDLLEAPMRPTKEVVGKFSEFTKDKDTLLLGCTSELYNKNITVIDNNQNRIDMFPHEGTICGNWLELTKYYAKKIDIIIGDGSLNVLKFSQWNRLIKECHLVSDTVVIRVFEAPKTLNDIYIGTCNGSIINMSHLKWLIGMQLAKSQFNPDVSVQDIRNKMYDIFNSKEELQAITGWHFKSIAIIDEYKDSDITYNFPTEKQIMQIFPNSTRLNLLGYPMSEYCPFYIFETNK